jgi:AcrR family transcriptional regulator
MLYKRGTKIMVGIKNNRRTQYTKKVIKEAVLSLLEDNSPETITVIDVCKIADVNRSTFYRYYDDIYACIDEIEGEFIDDLKIPDNMTPMEGLRALLEAFYKNPILSNLAFVEGKTKLLERLHDAIDKNHPTPKHQLILTPYTEIYVMTGMQGVLRKWVKGGLKETPAELTQIIWKLFFAEDVRELFDIEDIK